MSDQDFGTYGFPRLVPIRTTPFPHRLEGMDHEPAELIPVITRGLQPLLYADKAALFVQDRSMPASGIVRYGFA